MKGLVSRSLSHESVTLCDDCDGRRSVAFNVFRKVPAQHEAPVSWAVVAGEVSAKAMADDRQSWRNWDCGEKSGDVMESVSNVSRARSGGKGKPMSAHHWMSGIHD